MKYTCNNNKYKVMLFNLIFCMIKILKMICIRICKRNIYSLKFIKRDYIYVYSKINYLINYNLLLTQWLLVIIRYIMDKYILCDFGLIYSKFYYISQIDNL